MKKPTKALARQRSSKDVRHLMRYLKSKAGLSDVEIAKSEHVNVRQVRDSINYWEAYEQQNSDGQLQLAVRDLVISTLPQAKDTINNLLTAKQYVGVKNKKTGLVEDILVDDKTTQLEAFRLTKDLVIGLQPKVPANVVNVSQTNQVATIGSSETTEERIRRLRQKAQEHNLLPPEVIGVPLSIDESTGDDDEDDEDDRFPNDEGDDED